jgi:hypothetical protein
LAPNQVPDFYCALLAIEEHELSCSDALIMMKKGRLQANVASTCIIPTSHQIVAPTPYRQLSQCLYFRNKAADVLLKLLFI